MIKKIGKFDFYVPKITAIDILKAIFMYLDENQKYSGNPSRYNRFFLRMKQDLPELFEDIPMDDDNFLPYSMEIEQAFSLAQDYQIIARPNPDIYPFEIRASKKRLKQDIKDKFTSQELSALRKIAQEFKKELEEVA